jgi:hypothetical protein
VTSWSGLYAHFNAQEQERSRAAGADHDYAQAVRALDLWSDQVTTQVFEALCTLATHRATAFRVATGASVAVLYPGEPALEVSSDGLRMTFLKLRLGTSDVDIYSHRRSGSPPSLHLVRSRRPDSGERGRQPARQLLSRPLCIVARLPDDRYALRRLSSGRISLEEPPLSVEDVVYDAFELLVIP